VTIRDHRHESDPPRAIAEWGWRFHHVGIPTTDERPGERHLPEFGMYVTGFPTSPFGVEWMRFEPDSPIAPILQRVPHVAFEVDDLDTAIRDKHLLGDVSAPAEGIRVAMILHDGAPIELIEFRRSRAREEGS